MAAKKISGTSKKDLRKNLETKMEQAISGLVDTADKKFHKLLKKAAKVLADGMHTRSKTKSVAPAKKKAAPLKNGGKKS
ncbi:MAG: hypothetical protein JO301_17690 [Chitinophagaceae bacterium]|nr:hypothetical protein [Chitinophagaceae bacterium]